MAILTDELILTKSGAKSVTEVRNLNLWGCELDDIGILKNCSSLETLSLSVNNLTTLEQLSECKGLKELYLRKNFINDVEQVKFLTALRNLEVLWLCDNPCANDETKYRSIVLRYLPWLKKLDHHDVTDEEVLASMSSLPPTMPPKIRNRLTSSKNLSNEGLNENELSKKIGNIDNNNDFASTSSDNIGANLFKSSSWTPKPNYDLDSLYKSPKPIRANLNGILSFHGNGQNSPRARSPAINSNRPPSRPPSRTPPPSQEGGIKLVKSKSNNGSSKTNGSGNLQPKSPGKPTSAPLSRTPSRTPPPKLNNISEDFNIKNDPRQSNVLTAVLALIDELEEKDLHVVQRKLQLVMLNRQGKPGKK
ncbi:protein tilB homolog isoform X3 [Rhizophagus clarus]|uniref:Protein tilB homolog isoform X3 n=1 Tax=Rhizophagus clarus TaxID=94130 RepID=A0A8H3LQC7_9GLOM|nr:protein tilB homolog isoform X3 [Rhizophagus clarus]